MDINLDKLTDQDIMERMNIAYNEYTRYWNEISRRRIEKNDQPWHIKKTYNEENE